MRPRFAPRRKILEDELEELKSTFFTTIKVNQQLSGTIENIVDYGVFINFGGIEGLCHVTQIPGGKFKYLDNQFKTGNTVTVQVVSVDRIAQKVDLKMLTEVLPKT